MTDVVISRAQETMAIELQIERRHGPDGPVFIAEQLGAAALAEDDAGVARWREIAAAYQKLQGGSRQ